MRRRRLQSGQPRWATASLVLIGLIVGLGLALYYAWIVEPVVFVAASPARLNDEFKSEYILLVSQSYASDGNWERAERRLMALNDPDISGRVASQLEAFLRSGRPAPVMRNLAILAERLGVSNPAVAVFVPQVAATVTATASVESVSPTPTQSPEPSRTRPPTPTPLPPATATARPSPTPVPVYRLLSQEQVCQRRIPVPRIEVETVDGLLEPLPGVEVIISWPEGTDHFFTGFQPEKGRGYGDFGMSPDISYSVVLADGSPTVSGLQIETCSPRQGGLAGGWRLTFQNTDVTQETATPEG